MNEREKKNGYCKGIRRSVDWLIEPEDGSVASCLLAVLHVKIEWVCGGVIVQFPGVDDLQLQSANHQWVPPLPDHNLNGRIERRAFIELSHASASMLPVLTGSQTDGLQAKYQVGVGMARRD